MENKNTFKDDIEKAEKAVLVISSAGIFSALAVIAFAIWGI